MMLLANFFEAFITGTLLCLDAFRKCWVLTSLSSFRFQAFALTRSFPFLYDEALALFGIYCPYGITVESQHVIHQYIVDRVTDHKIAKNARIACC
jgi:hypothetical protein